MLYRQARFRSHALIPVALVVAALAATPGCQKPQAPRQQPVSIDTATSRTADVPVTVSAIGTVEPLQRVTMRARVSGTIQEVLFQEGAAVTGGQVLFKIDPRPFEAASMQASAQLRAAEIQAEGAHRDLARADVLLEKKMISEGEHDALRVAAQSADAAVALQKAAVRSAALNLEFSTIRAPISGRAGQFLAHRGDLVTANATDLVQINQLAPIAVRFSVPEKDLTAVRTAFAAGEVPVTAVPSAGGDQASEGKLSFIDNSVDEKTGSLVLKAEFPNADERLWPGQFVQVSTTLGTEKDAVVVPSHAVQTGQSGPFVFVIDEQGAARLRLVKSGRLSGPDMVISDGMKAGETVVTDGQLKLADGTPTRLKTAADAGKAKE